MVSLVYKPIPRARLSISAGSLNSSPLDNTSPTFASDPVASTSEKPADFNNLLLSAVILITSGTVNPYRGQPHRNIAIVQNLYHLAHLHSQHLLREPFFLNDSPGLDAGN